MKANMDCNVTMQPAADTVRPLTATTSSTRKCKDWSAIHQREFDKMDSLDEFLAKRQQRRRVLKTPPKRAAAFSASLKLPGHVTQDQHRSIARPVMFAPTVLSTSKINTNFSTMYKTPSAANAVKTPFKVGLSANKTFTTATKENGPRTPLDCTATNKSLLSTSVVAAKKPVFDIKASLARPLTWTPHTGRLKPLSTRVTGHVDVKAVRTKTREERREEAKAMRQEQRRAVLMQRRQ
jgi:hypothetical protein